MGGKTKLARRLIKLFPAHDSYIEPFIGGGSVFLAKPPVKTEVINDIDTELIVLWRGMKTMATKLRGKDFVAKKDLFERLKKSKPRGTLQRMYRMIYIFKNSFGGLGKVFANKGIKTPARNLKANLGKYEERLKGVTILNKDWKAVLRKYDSTNSFSFIDPPYESEIRQWIYKGTDPISLLPTLKRMKGTFLMTYEYSAANKRLFKAAEFRVKVLNTTYSVEPGSTSKKRVLVVMNY